MKSNAPWSVKGIERDARETAKEAARREGMTVGEWLNQMIYSQAEGGAPGALSDTEVEGLKLRDIVTAIEHLRNRVVEAESKHAAAVSELTRNMGGFVERVQRLERVKPSEGSHQDIAQRIEKLERAGGDRHRIEALKALEKAVAQVAIQFNNAQRTTLTRLDSAEQQLQEFAERIDNVGNGGGDMGPFKSAIEGLAERVARAERIAQEAASLKTAAADSTDPEFVERTGARLRVLGDEIKRGGDQIRALEGTITKLSSQIEAAEKRSADGVQKVAETIAEVRSQLLAEGDRSDGANDVEAILAAARAETEGKLEALQRSLDEMDARFETLAKSAPAAPAAPVDAPAADDDADAIAAEIEEAINASGDESDASADDVINEIEEAVASLETSVETAEEDPFAFADEFDDREEPEDLNDENDPVEDFSFQLDDDNADDGGEDDITVSADDSEEEDTPLNNAQALLAEVRNALSGGGEAENDEDDDAPVAAQAEITVPSDEDDEEDEQAPNTASLAPTLAPDADDKDSAPLGAATKEDLVRAARRRAREAAARNAEESAQPRRMQLSAKQRAILAARARQKRAEQEVADGAKTDETPDEKPALTLAQPIAPVAPEDESDTEEKAPGGRFAKITAALSSARALLKRGKKADDDAEGETHEAASAAGFAPAPHQEEDSRRRNVDRAALESIRANASARPLTIALGAAILLAVAALIYLVKDFVIKPDDGSRPTPATQETPAPASDQTTEAVADNLPVVPPAPAMDPQAVYLASMEALAAAADEDSALAAIAKLQDAAALGYPPAQLQLGELYKTGQGVEQDLGQARVWFRRAANGGNVLAMHRIGVMTARGDGGPADSQEAIAWFEQAANFGLVDSQYNLGAIFHPSADGSASVQDAGKAYYWYSLAARNGDEQAQPLAAGVAVALSAQQRAEIDARVAEWRAEAADKNANLNANAG